jgi:hypothetical protein
MVYNGVMVAMLYQTTFYRRTDVLFRSFEEDEQRYLLVFFCFDWSNFAAAWTGNYFDLGG